VALEDTNINCIKNQQIHVLDLNFFSERVITAWKGLAIGTDFRSLARFKSTILAKISLLILSVFSFYFILLFMCVLFSSATLHVHLFMGNCWCICMPCCPVVLLLSSVFFYKSCFLWQINDDDDDDETVVLTHYYAYMTTKKKHR